ncbi:DoxX family protein [Streptomyces sp. NBC_00631]|uniref:DoxX family protein n=1 Tax=Streptomyces sp. NBC_00631 TaxID=2975793 RepID=UPI0038657F79
MAAAIGVVLYFLGAVITHVRGGDTKGVGIPAVIMFVAAVPLVLGSRPSDRAPHAPLAHGAGNGHDGSQAWKHHHESLRQRIYSPQDLALAPHPQQGCASSVQNAGFPSPSPPEPATALALQRSEEEHGRQATKEACHENRRLGHGLRTVAVLSHALPG